MTGDEDAVALVPQGTELRKRQVSIRQEYAIQLLREGLKDSEVASLVGIRPSLLRAWKENPRFRRATAWAPLRVAKSSLALLAAAVFERTRRRLPEPETPWTSEKEDESDE
jgi:transposase